MKSRAELDAEWMAIRAIVSESADLAIAELLAAERAYVDREQQAAAIRWVRHAPWDWESGDFAELDAIADRVASGELAVIVNPGDK